MIDNFAFAVITITVLVFDLGGYVIRKS